MKRTRVAVLSVIALASAVLFSVLFRGTPSVTVRTTPPPRPVSGPGLNAIQAENRKLGTTAWRIPDHPAWMLHGARLVPQGYASRSSVVAGDHLTLFISASTRVVHVDVYRMGWYRGKGGRLVASFLDRNAGAQPRCPTLAPTRLIECSWHPSLSFVIPQTWVTGVYLIKLTDAIGRSSYIPVVVREAMPQAAILYQAPVTTWQAYNYWGQRDLYGGPGCSPPEIVGSQQHPTTSPSSTPSTRASSNVGTGPSPGGRAARTSSSPTPATSARPSAKPTPVALEPSSSHPCFKERAYAVSFDRPYGSGGAYWFLRYELGLVEWLERSGYDLGYATDVDTDLGLDRPSTHQVIIAAGHDEYWSHNMRAALQTAIGDGTSVAFIGANDVFRRIRFERSKLGPDRIIVNYKSATLDPVAVFDPANGTQNWDQGPRAFPVQPLVGAAYLCDRVASAWRPTLQPSWLFAHTGFRPGSHVDNMVGPEVDQVNNKFPRPRDEILVAISPVLCGSRRAASDSTLYRAASGALVFDAGTLWFSCALASDPSCPIGPDVRVERLATNLIGRMIGASNAARARHIRLQARAVSKA